MGLETETCDIECGCLFCVGHIETDVVEPVKSADFGALGWPLISRHFIRKCVVVVTIKSYATEEGYLDYCEERFALELLRPEILISRLLICSSSWSSLLADWSLSSLI